MTSVTSTLAAVKQRCIERDMVHDDQYVDLTSLSMDAKHPKTLLVKRGRDAETKLYPFDDHVYRLMGKVLPGLPASYLQKLVEKDPQLAADNFNFWVKDIGSKDVLLRYRKGDGKGGSEDRTVRAMLPATWRPLNYATAVDKLIEQFGPDQPASVGVFDSEEIAIDVIYGKLGKEAVVGDVVSWGMRYRDSDVGLLQKLSMAAFTSRLVCRNGAVHTRDGVGVNISHTDKIFDEPQLLYGTLVNGLTSISNYADVVANASQKAHTIRLADPAETINRINERFHVGKVEAEHVTESWNAEAALDPTAYRLMQSYTRAANSDELPTESRFRLQSVGGNVLNLAMSNYRFN